MNHPFHWVQIEYKQEGGFLLFKLTFQTSVIRIKAMFQNHDKNHIIKPCYEVFISLKSNN